MKTNWFHLSKFAWIGCAVLLPFNSVQADLLCTPTAWARFSDMSERPKVDGGSVPDNNMQWFVKENSGDVETPIRITRVGELAEKAKSEQTMLCEGWDESGSTVGCRGFLKGTVNRQSLRFDFYAGYGWTQLKDQDRAPQGPWMVFGNCINLD